jgi:flavin-dependent dehydrogenase
MMPDVRVDYDVVVIGGGLGGLALSILLCKAGRSVLVLEKDDYPRHKVCGEYVSLESWPFLQNLGLPLEAMDLPRITRLEVTDTCGRGVHMRLPLGGFGISRWALDGGLAELAKSSGVELKTHCKADARGGRGRAIHGPPRLRRLGQAQQYGREAASHFYQQQP